MKRDANAASGGELDAGQRALLADMEIRISQLETEIRNLTGLFEEVLYKQNNIERELDLFRRDVDLRFQDLKTGTSNPEVSAGLTPPVEPQNDQVGDDEPVRTAWVKPITSEKITRRPRGLF